MLEKKYYALSRSITLLSDELKAWVGYVSNKAQVDNVFEKNYSQIRVLSAFVEKLCSKNEAVLSPFNNTALGSSFLNSVDDLTRQVAASQSMWDFYRTRLEQRLIPSLQKPLRMADLVAHSCYHGPVLQQAKALRLKRRGKLLDYPLVNLQADLYPLIRFGWEKEFLPLSTIDFRWDHLKNPWELTFIAHEVGHALDRDFSWASSALAPLFINKVSYTHVAQWQRWVMEIFADLVGVLLNGPAFVKTLSQLLLSTKTEVEHIGVGPHPPRYLRVFINTVALRQLSLSQYADDIERDWRSVYGDLARFRPYLPEAEAVVDVMLTTPLVALTGRKNKPYTLCEFIEFDAQQQNLIESVKDALLAGKAPKQSPPIRYVISAVQLAFETLAVQGQLGAIAELAQHTQDIIIQLQPSQQLAAGLSNSQHKHLDDLAEGFLDHAAQHGEFDGVLS